MVCVLCTAQDAGVSVAVEVQGVNRLVPQTSHELANRLQTDRESLVLRGTGWEVDVILTNVSLHVGEGDGIERGVEIRMVTTRAPRSSDRVE